MEHEALAGGSGGPSAHRQEGAGLGRMAEPLIPSSGNDREPPGALTALRGEPDPPTRPTMSQQHLSSSRAEGLQGQVHPLPRAAAGLGFVLRQGQGLPESLNINQVARS